MRHANVIERLQRIRQFYRDTIEDYTAVEAIDKAISALEKQEQSCDTCRHKHEHFSGKRCGNCSVGYPDRYEAESNFEATSK